MTNLLKLLNSLKKYAPMNIPPPPISHLLSNVFSVNAHSLHFFFRVSFRDLLWMFSNCPFLGCSGFTRVRPRLPAPGPTTTLARLSRVCEEWPVSNTVRSVRRPWGFNSRGDPRERLVGKRIAIKEGLYRIQILCRRHPFWSYPAGLTIADLPG